MIQIRCSGGGLNDLGMYYALLIRIDDLPCAPGLSTILGRVLQDVSYNLLVAEDEQGEELLAVGLMTFFKQPMLPDENILAIEALWFKSHTLASQLPIWRALVSFCRKLDFGAVCISAESTNSPRALRELIEAGVLDDSPVTLGELPLQKVGNPSPVWSAFAREPITGSAFVSVPSITIHTKKVEVDVSGRRFDCTKPLYRGEGRLEWSPHWHCANLRELVAVHFAKGFFARARISAECVELPFTGTIAEQILHQANVAQGAVSLSTSFAVAARYATHRGRRDEAVVFTVDAERLRCHAPVFDTTATLVAACPWIPLEAWTPLQRVVRALSFDLPSAGQFLEQCFKGGFERAKTGLGSFAARPDVLAFLTPEARAAVDGAGIGEAELATVHAVFVEFAEYALQRVGTVDDLHLDLDGSYSAHSHRVGPMAYFEMFAAVEASLQKLPRANRGLDFTPLGYIAKTVRDDECLASGSVPGDCIMEAAIVDRFGRVVRRVKPSLA